MHSMNHALGSDATTFSGTLLASDVDHIFTNLKSDLTRIDIGSEKWKMLILEAIGKWPLASEKFDGEIWYYLIGGEAFDWRLLAYRLMRGCDLFSRSEKCLDWVSAPMLFGGFQESDFMRFLGVDKFRAHLSYFYGVTVEQALIVAVEEEITHRRVSGGRELTDRALELAYEILYNSSRDQLWNVYKLENGVKATRPNSRYRYAHSLGEEDAFTYWLHKLRLEESDPAKIASDTRKGLATLERIRKNDVRRQAIMHSDRLRSGII